ncbi:hypothetical protein IWW39_004860 [Coemansia spiralis]|uniref:G-patch domain-containing protein n=1 Tax=Coemansia spiralis TaxID=417178 RepID=A0A9W8GB36_9FUNG|nr:hypothetical protein IWW39_004860 [Coemansia spiralis]
MYGERPALGFDDSSDEEEHAQRQRQTQRSRKAPTKEELMLGLWADDDDDEEGHVDRGAASRRNTNDHFGSNVLRPVGFVAATDNPAVIGDKDSAASDDDDNTSGSDSDSSSGSSSPSISDREAASELKEELPMERKSDTLQPTHMSSTLHRGPVKAPAPSGSKDFGKFASGAVWNMMAKMGYKPGEGLGKHGEGRIEPIQVTLRRAGEGISFSGSERPLEKKSSPAPATKGRQRGGRSGADGLPREQRDSQAQVRARQKTEYKTLEELQRRTDAQLKEVFVDMTTNTEVGSFSELAAKRLPLGERDKLAGDVRLGMDLASARLEELGQEQARAEAKVDALSKKMQNLSTSIERRQARTSYLQAIKESVCAVQATANATLIESVETAKDDLSALYDAYKLMYEAAQRIEAQHKFDVWGELRLETVVTGTVHSHFQRLFRDWNPAAHPDIIESVLTPLYPFVHICDASESSERLAPIESLLYQTLVPGLKRFILTQWNPLADDLSLPLSHLPPVIVAAVSEDISNKLLRHVNAIEPRKVMNKFNSQREATHSSASQPLADLRVDRIVIPWLPYISDRAELVSSVRRKLCEALDYWTPTKESNSIVLSLVYPWAEIIQGKELRKLSAKVSDRLEAMLRAEFQFNAQRQVVWPFKVLVKWHSVLPSDAWLALAKRQVLSKFIDYLRLWLEDPNADYAEIADWYWQWRQLHPPEIFALEAVQQEFKKALVLMAYALSQQEDPLPAV